MATQNTPRDEDGGPHSLVESVSLSSDEKTLLISAAVVDTDVVGFARAGGLGMTRSSG